MDSISFFLVAAVVVLGFVVGGAIATSLCTKATLLQPIST
jgi:hypothetical protein